MFDYYLFVIRSLLEPIDYLSVRWLLRLPGLCPVQVTQPQVEDVGNKWVCIEHVQTSLVSIPQTIQWQYSYFHTICTAVGITRTLDMTSHTREDCAAPMQVQHYFYIRDLVGVREYWFLWGCQN